jgi:hypothetical protein
MTSHSAFDVVIVPDFSGKASVTFEARTLYFLASWMEFAGDAGRFPLHLACIGEPPASVRELARRCGAIISLHDKASAELGVYANKLRGFEAPLRTGRILLLDVDILVLSDLSELAAIVPDDAISAAPSHSAIMLPEMWTALYARLGLTPPPDKIADFHRTLDMARDRELFPSFNTGVIVAPRDSPLSALWLEHMAVLGDFRAPWNPRLKPLNMSVTDEPAFATALHELRRRGQLVVPLPDRFNGRWRHLYRRSPSMADFVVFHMTSSFSHGTSLADKLRPSAWGYQKKMFRRYGKRWLTHSTSHLKEAATYLVPASVELLRLRPILQTLYTKHISPVV